MGNLTQKDRVISIRSPLGEDVLLLNKVRAEEKISELFAIDVELLYHEREDDKYDIKLFDGADLVGQTVSIQINQDDDGIRTMTGLVNSFHIGGRTRQFTYYYATIVPHIWLLTKHIQSKIFQQKTVPDILREVLDGFEVKFQLKNEYKQRNYCVQYQESSFDFISRLMEEEGIYYYFEHTPEMDKMVLRDDFTQPEDCPRKSVIGILNEELNAADPFESSVKHLKIDYKMQSGKVNLWDYNFQYPKKNLEVEKTSVFEVSGNKKLEIYNYQGGYARKYDGIDKSGGEQPAELSNIFTDNKRTINNRMFMLDSQYKILTGISDCSTFTVGHRFELKNHPNAEFNTKYIILSVKHEVDQTPSYAAEDYVPIAYRNEFTCIEHGSGKPEYRTPLKTPKPRMFGSQTALVVGPAGEEIFTDKYGRVKVQFHWDREGKADPGSSCWLRVATSIAGNHWGTMFIPRIGQEVVVNFLEGDPDQPIIVGSVYNPDTMPHYELPKYKTLSYFKSRTTPDDGKGFNEIRFEDKQGKEQVFMHSQKRMDIRIRESFYETCGANRQELIGVRSDNKPGGNLAITVGGNYDLHVKKDWYIGIDGKLNEGVKGEVVEDYQSSQSTVVKSKVEVNAREITLEGSQKVTLKVGSSCVIVDMMGITIQGPMVKINSGGAATPTSPVTIDDPLDAEAADTGEPGYLDKPRSGAGKGRNSRTLNGQHAPAVTYHPGEGGNPSYYTVGGDKLRVQGDDNFTGKALNDLSELYNTPTGKKVIDDINSGSHTTTIETLDEATARRNGGLATRLDPTGSVTPGQGSDTKIQYNPDVPDGGYTDENGNDVTLPNSAMLGHELIHAIHNDKGNNLRDNPEPAEPDSNEEESQTIGIHGHKDDELTHNNILKDLGVKHRRTDHDTSVVTVP